MREILEIAATAVSPGSDAILARQGVSNARAAGLRVAELARAARALFVQLAEPRAVVDAISAAEFAVVYQGEGRNAPATPLAEVYPRAAHLALYVVTLGADICARIDTLFETRDFALASLLDAAASAGAERLERWVERRYLEQLAAPERAAPPRPRADRQAASRRAPGMRALTYSPGYCGWHVSGQRALFARLRPQEIGVTLRESFLMEPLKSISGVIVAGPPEIHDFAAEYPFCGDCATHECRQRIRRVLEG